MNSIEYIISKNRNDYQRDNFDSFLRKIKFSFDVPSIHITGTNGKGSTATFLKDIYKANGYKVGLFTSPDDFFEMIKINDTNIDINFVDKVVDEYKKLFDKFDLSTFEIQTFIAFKWFNDQKVDLAVIECGMGGAFDATNIFTPILSIITSISIEHSDFLGVSLSEIALHKSGIIKDGVPTLIGELEGDALDVVVNKCKQSNSKLVVVDHYHHLKSDLGLIFDYRPYYNLKINSSAEYRVMAACLAVEATNLLQNRFPVNEEKLKQGLLGSKLKCRFEEIKGQPLIILDGAHNPHGINQLRKEMDKNYSYGNVHIVFASFKDKNIALMLPEIGLIGDITLTTFENGRARGADDYFLFLDDYKYENDYKSLIDNLITTYPEDIILVTGSLTFTYEVRKYLKQKGLINE